MLESLQVSHMFKKNNLFGTLYLCLILVVLGCSSVYCFFHATDDCRYEDYPEKKSKSEADESSDVDGNASTNKDD